MKFRENPRCSVAIRGDGGISIDRRSDEGAPKDPRISSVRESYCNLQLSVFGFGGCGVLPSVSRRLMGEAKGHQLFMRYSNCTVNPHGESLPWPGRQCLGKNTTCVSEDAQFMIMHIDHELAVVPRGLHYSRFHRITVEITVMSGAWSGASCRCHLSRA